ncbi:MAG: efflux RND transporter permease subunit [Proteobacteria bacterium]|nr:efflux RND transporter permease subunit [Pseudomonadota bacterium]
MNLSRPFILRPVATTLLMLALLMSGLFAYRLLPVAALPQVDYPTIQVLTLYPGASPSVTTSAVTAPLERRLGQIPGLDQMASTSSGGASVITLKFALEVDLGVAEQEVQAAINAANTFLPDDLPMPPVYRKVNPADTPIITLAVTSRTLPLPEVYDLVDTRMAQRLSQLPGVGLVSLAGGQRPAMRIEVNPTALAAAGAGMDDIRAAIAASNVNMPKGSFDGPIRAIMLDANDQMRTVEEYRDLVIAWQGGAPLRLGDVARIEQGAENRQLAAWSGDVPAILVNIQRQPGANVIEVVEGIQALLPRLRAAMPQAVAIEVLSDRTESIRASIKGVQHELLLAIGLVVLVTFVFLRTIPATIIPSLAVPLSLVATFGFMLLAGFSLNNLTLMALTIATGFVVDDAIVMLENVARHLEEGKSRLEAALDGARQIGFTLVSLTISLIAVLIPLLFMDDVVGRLFREFAITLAISILISAIVALTLVPMLTARWMKPESEGEAPALVRWTMAWFDAVARIYAVMLDWVFAYRAITLLFFVATLALTVALYIQIPKGLFPEQDTGQIRATIVADQDVSFQRMSSLQAQIADAILADPEIASLSSNVGVDGQNPTLNQGRMLINLVAKDQRGPQNALLDRLRERARAVPGVTLHLQPVQDLTIETETGANRYRFSLEGAKLDEVNATAERLLAALRREPMLRDPTSNVLARGASVTVAIDRDAAARLGISAATIDAALYNAFGQRIVSTIFAPAAQYRVILESQPGMLATPDSLNRLYVPVNSTTSVPLGTIARFVTGQAPLLVSRVAQYPAATIGFDVASGVALGDAVDRITATAAQIGIPPGVTIKFTGTASAFRAALSNQIYLILAAIIVVYIVLGVLYESFVHPVTILSTLPSAGVGALVALMLTGNDLGVIGIIGLVLLIGIVKKNAIIMIDFAIEARRAGETDPVAAIRQAALLRFRPILMTTLAALFAALPLIFGAGMGAELRQPLGIAIAGGLIVSQALTLFTTPVIFLFFDRLGR